MQRVAICYDGPAPLDPLAGEGLHLDRHLTGMQVIYGRCLPDRVAHLEQVAGVRVVAPVRA